MSKKTAPTRRGGRPKGSRTDTSGVVAIRRLIAAQVREARLKSGLSRAELAGRMNTFRQHVQQLESCTESTPTVSTLARIADALGAELVVEFRF